MINSPVAGDNAKWVPSINWDSATVCEYSYDNFATDPDGASPALDCTKGGSDLPRPNSTDANGNFISYNLTLRGINNNPTPGVSEKTISFTYNNTVPTYTTCGADKLDESTRSYYYLNGPVIGDCIITADNIEFRGAEATSSSGYSISGNIIATTTTAGLNINIKNMTVGGTIYSNATTNGSSAGNIIISRSTVAVISANGLTTGSGGSIDIATSTASSITSTGLHGGSVTLTNSTSTDITTNGGTGGTGGNITVTRSNAGNLSSNGTLLAGDVIVTNSMTGNISDTVSSNLTYSRSYISITSSTIGNLLANSHISSRINISSSTAGTISANGDGTSGSSAADITILNSTVSTISANGGTNGNGGPISIATSTTGYLSSTGYAAGNITVANSTVNGAVTATGNNHSGNINITHSTVTSAVSSSGTGNLGVSAGSVTVSNSTVSTISANGSPSTSSSVDGGNGGTINIATSTTAAISANGANSLKNGGNGGTINITYSLASASSTPITSNGGSSSSCGTGGSGGIITFTSSSDDYNPITSNGGAGNNSTCSGSSKPGGVSHPPVVIGHAPGWTPPPPPPTPTPTVPPGGGGGYSGVPFVFRTPLIIPVATVNPLNLISLPIFGDVTATSSKNIFSFQPLFSNFLFTPLSKSFNGIKGYPQMSKYLASVGLSTSQDLLTLKNKSLPLPLPAKNADIPDGLLMLSSNGTSIPLNAVYDSKLILAEQATVNATSSITVSMYPTTKGIVTVTFNGTKYTLKKVGKTSLLSTTIVTPSPGTYTLTATGAPLPLVLNVVSPKPVTPVTPDKVKNQSVWSVLKFW